MTNTFELRPYRAADRQAIRDICVATAWQGEPAPQRIGDDWIWAEYWTRYFTDREPRHSWVIVRPKDGAIVGYLTGTDDARRVERYVPWLLPGMVARVVTRRLLRNAPSRAAILGLLRSAIRGELDVPHGIRNRYPATLHLDLLPEARGHGLGRKLFELYLQRMRSANVAGVHAQTLSANTAITRLNTSMGFRLVATHPLAAYRHIDPEPIDIHTWVLDLRGT